MVVGCEMRSEGLPEVIDVFLVVFLPLSRTITLFLSPLLIALLSLSKSHFLNMEEGLAEGFGYVEKKGQFRLLTN